MIEIRLSVRAAGELHRTEWATAHGEPDDALDADVVERARAQLVDALDGEALLPVQFVQSPGLVRVLAARAVEWVDVELRRVPELVSTVEAARLLDVSRQRVLQLRDDHDDFPRPVEGARGLEWSRSELLAWRATRPGGGRS